MAKQIYDTTINYTLEYRNRQKQWVKLKAWSRPFTLSKVLDETLDEGVLTLNAAPLQKLPPFTPLRLTVETIDGQNTTTEYLHFITQQNPVKTVRFA